LQDVSSNGASMKTDKTARERATHIIPV
jgi:hypothetical protein